MFDDGMKVDVQEMRQTAFKSNIRFYWTVWFVMVSTLLIIRLLAPGLLETRPIELAYMLFSSVPIMIINMVEGYRLHEYLKKHHCETFNYITYLPLLKISGVHNSVRGLQFLYSDDDLGDPNVAVLKRNYREFIRLMCTVFVTMPLLFIVLNTDSLCQFVTLTIVVMFGMLFLWGVPFYIIKKFILKQR